jgi:natural product precursor
MKKIISSFANSLLSREQMKSVKGGDFYCQCAGGNPVANPNNQDCLYVCTGTTPGAVNSLNNYYMVIPGTPCTSYTTQYLGNAIIGGWSNC